ncbi:alpha-soluble NSF attachment protein 2-like isoform X4 [Mangifera indica]|uniref:alpha-soluble NSF attachment protein 2-like isoform X4 n=1 Tax=Mangifera indica TaxID=29780 RepID=UPI001CFB9828|nr:alpha-soluble NSF attachment protein 2-like isoform X4 [Mangifera indica]XP_044481167.1 alpha-soluble NSF attachment protein 2-like isoform X4 [Mangifera indica]
MSDHLAKAQEFEKKAEKKIKSWSLFGSRYDDAAELYAKSANHFKLAKSWDRAGSLYVILSDCHLKIISMKLPLLVLMLQTVTRKLQTKDIEATTSANQCKLKVAQFSAQQEQYQKAIEIYEKIARQSLNINLLKYGVRGHLLNAGLCQLCRGDVVAITNALERYENLDLTFSRTREYKFLADLATTIEEEDVTKFTHVVREFDSITRLDPWKTTLLWRVKEALKAKELEEDDLT